MSSRTARMFVSVLAAGSLTAAAAPAAFAGASSSREAAASDLPAWFSNPLTSAQLRAEVAIPTRLTVNGPLQRTTAMYATQSGALAVPADEAYGQAVIAGESLVLDGSLFPLGSSVPTAAAGTEIRRLTSALRFVTSVQCQGHTAYSSQRQPSSAPAVALKRAESICSIIHRADPAIATTDVGFGDSHPSLIGGTFGQRTGNRRTIVRVTGASVGHPAAPIITSAAGGDHSATLTITPADGGPLPILGYQYSTNDGRTWQNLDASGSVTGSIAGLTNGELYTIEVRGADAAGYSETSNSVTVTPGTVNVPGAPTITSGSWTYNGGNGDYEIALGFTVPSSTVDQRSPATTSRRTDPPTLRSPTPRSGRPTRPASTRASTPAPTTEPRATPSKPSMCKVPVSPATPTRSTWTTAADSQRFSGHDTDVR